MQNFSTSFTQNKLNSLVTYSINMFLGTVGNVKLIVTSLRLGSLDICIQCTSENCFVFVMKRGACPAIQFDCNKITAQ